MLDRALLTAILICCLYLVWRAKDSHWHSQAVWERLGDIKRDAFAAVHDEGYDRGRADGERIASGMSPNIYNPYRDGMLRYK